MVRIIPEFLKLKLKTYLWGNAISYLYNFVPKLNYSFNFTNEQNKEVQKEELDIDFKNGFLKSMKTKIYHGIINADFKNLVTISSSILTKTLTSARYGYNSMRILKNYCISKKKKKSNLLSQLKLLNILINKYNYFKLRLNYS